MLVCVRVCSCVCCMLVCVLHARVCAACSCVFVCVRVCAACSCVFVCVPWWWLCARVCLCVCCVFVCVRACAACSCVFVCVLFDQAIGERWGPKECSGVEWSGVEWSGVEWSEVECCSNSLVCLLCSPLVAVLPCVRQVREGEKEWNWGIIINFSKQPTGKGSMLGRSLWF